jgi:hypothetical protein
LIISFIDAVVRAARLEGGAGDCLHVAKKHQEKETSKDMRMAAQQALPNEANEGFV